MDITKKQLESIVATLPIGLYCGRRIPVTISETAETSYYVPTTDSIVISLQIISDGLKNVKEEDGYTKEMAVRAMLYHEVSHAFLTPSFHNYMDRKINIFEDERIETILKGYYLDTNFKQNLFYICGGPDSLTSPRDAYQAFFQVVRYRFGKQEFVDRVQQIIDKYEHLNCNNDIWNDDNSDTYHYRDDIFRLFRDIENDFRQNPQDYQYGDGEDNQNGEDGQDGDGQGGGSIEKGMLSDLKDAIKKLIEDEANSGSEDVGKQEGSAKEEGEGDGAEESKTTSKCAGRGKLGEVVAQTDNKYRNSKLHSQLEAIFASFNKKNNTGSGMTAYTGVFNPRNVARKDYKYFDKKCSVNGNNKYGTCHLNLFIDNSGSFDNNAPAVNTLLAELYRVSRKNPNFTFDLIKCGDDMKETTQDTMYIEANEGTHLSYEKTKKIWTKHQKRNTLCHNIILYDGYCSTDEFRCGKNSFSLFDTKNTTLILESSNRDVITHCDYHNAKVIYENNDYTGKLVENVLRVLQRAF